MKIGEWNGLQLFRLTVVLAGVALVVGHGVGRIRIVFIDAPQSDKAAI